MERRGEAAVRRVVVGVSGTPGSLSPLEAELGFPMLLMAAQSFATAASAISP